MNLPIPILSALIGAVILFFGRKLFWLCVAAVGFAAGVELAPHLMHQPTPLMALTIALVLGFIGDSHDTWWTDDLGEDFADDICDGDTIATSWVDRAYSWWVDDDSIAIAAGETQADAINRREHETLNWRDIAVNSTNWLAWKWRR